MQTFQSILHAVASHAETIPDKVALIEAETDRKCTYGELWAYVKAFARRLAKAGIKRDLGDGYGSRAVICCTQTIDSVIAELAIQLAGGVIVPIEKNIAASRIVEIMEETDCKILIAPKPLLNYEYTFIPLTDAAVEKETGDVNLSFPSPDNLAYILFTTGTTGNSKGVMLSHNAITSRTVSSYSVYNHGNNQTWLVPIPVSHAAGLLKIFVSLFYQCTAVLLDGYTFANSFFSAIKKYNVTILCILSAAAEMYVRTYQKYLQEISNQIHLIVLGSSSYSEALIDELRNIFSKSKIIELYGASEVPGCFIDHSQNRYGAFCVGKPRPGIELVFFDEQKNNIIETNKENPGLFAMNHISKMLGYWKEPELTASVVRGDYIVLSDLGYKGDNGLYYFLGRADDVIVSGGYKIAPLEIETAANSYDGIRESACVPISDAIMGQVPKLYVVMEENHVFDIVKINSYLKGKLEATRVPRYIEQIDAIPKINNKINRKALKDS